MTWEQAAKLGQDYGPVILIIVVGLTVMILGITFLVKMWPVASATVDIVNALKKVPAMVTTVEGLDARVTALDGKIEEGRKITTGAVETVNALDAKVDGHLVQAARKEFMLEDVQRRMSLMEDNGKVIRHEVQPNGGSSMKDSLGRIEAALIARGIIEV